MPELDTPPPGHSLLAAAQKDGWAPPDPAMTQTDAPPAAPAPETPTPPVPTPDAPTEPAKAPDKPTDAAPEKKTLTKPGAKPWESLEAPKKPDAAPEKKVEAAADDDFPPPPEGTNEKGVVRWKELHQAAKERDTLKAQMAELNKKLETASPAKSEEITKQLEALRAERDELGQLVAERRLERTEEFQKAVTKPLAEADAIIYQIATIGGLDHAAMQKAVGLTDEIPRARAIEKVIAEANRVNAEKIESGDATVPEPLSAVLADKLLRAVDKLHTAWGEEDRLRANARDIEIAANTKDEAAHAQAAKADEESWTTAHNTMREELASKLTDIFGDEDLAKQAVESAVKPQSPIESAYQAYAGALLPHYVQLANTRAARIAELEGVVGERSKSRPSMGDGTPDLPKPEGGQRMTLAEAAAAALRAGQIM